MSIAVSDADRGVRGMDIIIGSNNGVGGALFSGPVATNIIEFLSRTETTHRILHYKHASDNLYCIVKIEGIRSGGMDATRDGKVHLSKGERNPEVQNSLLESVNGLLC